MSLLKIGHDSIGMLEGYEDFVIEIYYAANILALFSHGEDSE